MTNQKQPVINFSHLYPKLLDEHNDLIEWATLLDVSLVELADLSGSFLGYDTNYGEFPLPKKGQYLLLLFLKPPAIPGVCATNLFTTLRRSTPAKHNYYQALIGREFEVCIKLKEDQK